MNKFLLSLFVFMMFIAGLLNADTENNSSLIDFFKKLDSGNKQTVVAFGTSLTKYGAWVSLMNEWFGKEYPGLVTVINSGGPGQHSDWGVKQVKKLVNAHKPDLVFIEFSYNDAHTRFKLSVPHCRENLNKIVDTIKKANPNVVIVLQTMNVPLGNHQVSRPEIEKFNDNYRNYAKEQKVILIDNYPAWLKIHDNELEKYKKFVPDGSHPNKNGIIAVTWPAIKKVLESAKNAKNP